MPNLKVFFFFFCFGIFLSHAQYTETINTNRPGESQGAFAVGENVLQLEAGGYMGNDNHSLLETDTDIMGASYSLRYGLLTETLELNFFGSFEDQRVLDHRGNRTEEYKSSNFKQNTLGAKLLVFDPYKNLPERKPNLYSWKENQRFKWRELIPAISIYAGVNLMWWETPYRYENEAKFTPKAAIITQNNWGPWVLVLNFIGDKFTEKYPTYSGVATLTHAVTPRFAVFGEYQTYISDLYSDDIARAGAAYLLGKNLQVDISGLINFKDTPSRWQVATGVSYRLDYHKNEKEKQPEKVEDKSDDTQLRYEEGKFIKDE